MRDIHRSPSYTAPAIIRAKAANDLPARPDNAHGAVIAAEEQAVGAGAHGRDVAAALEDGARVVGVVGGEGDLCCVKEVEGSPL